MHKKKILFLTNPEYTMEEHHNALPQVHLHKQLSMATSISHYYFLILRLWITCG